MRGFLLNPVEKFEAAPARAASSTGLQNELMNTPGSDRSQAYAAMSGPDTTSKFLSPAAQLFDSTSTQTSEAIKFTPAPKPITLPPSLELPRPSPLERGTVHGESPVRLPAPDYPPERRVQPTRYVDPRPADWPRNRELK
jgi:hypothetical protein